MIKATKVNRDSISLKSADNTSSLPLCWLILLRLEHTAYTLTLLIEVDIIMSDITSLTCQPLMERKKNSHFSLTVNRLSTASSGDKSETSFYDSTVITTMELCWGEKIYRFLRIFQDFSSIEPKTKLREMRIVRLCCSNLPSGWYLPDFP